jgi:ABC-type sulfate transport system permease component
MRSDEYTPKLSKAWLTPSPIPGFGVSFGITLTLLSLIVLLPIGVLLWGGLSLGPENGCGRSSGRTG